VAMQHGTDAQEAHSIAGMASTDPGFGVEDASLHGLLTTYNEFDKSQTYDVERKKYVGRYPTITGRIRGFYEDLVDAIRQKAPLQVQAQQSRDAIRVMELARESHDKGAAVPWS
jgi:predicted dehydrogenase